MSYILELMPVVKWDVGVECQYMRSWKGEIGS